MLAFTIDDTLTKEFMNKLLRQTEFDAFEIRKIEIVNFTYFEISGEIPPEKPQIEELKETEEKSSEKQVAEEKANIKPKYCKWEQLRPYVFNIIKGSSTPRIIKVVFSLAPEIVENVHDNAAALFLNMTFDNGVTTFTTATSEKKFSMDKSLNHSWEDYVNKYFIEIGMPVNESNILV